MKRRHWHTRQAAHFDSLRDTPSGMLRVSIKRDSYDDQSYGKAELFSDGKWHHVYSIPYPQLRVIAKTHLQLTAFDFAEDEDALVEAAMEIVTAQR